MFARLLLPVAVVSLFVAPLSRAAIVAVDSTTFYTMAPADDFGFGNVGTVFNTLANFPASGVYLGGGWMMSAYHNVTNGAGGFAFNGVTLEGAAYSVDATTATRLHNPDSSLADLAIFKLTTIPLGLPSVTLSSVVSPVGTSLRLAGNGQNRLSSESHWQVSGSTWTEVASGGNAAGYKLDPAGSRGLRWGTNNLENSSQSINDIGYGPISAAITTDFGDNTLSAPSGEAQATPGDSGGGVFRKNGNTWELTGIIISTAAYVNQPASTAVFGNLTYAASIPTYRDEIVSTIGTVPEPASTTLLLAGAGLLLRRRRVT